MATRQRKNSFLSRFILPVFAFAFLGYFGFHTFHGSYGLIAFHAIRSNVDQLEAELAKVRAEREALELRVALLRPGSLAREVVDEFARAKLNVTHPNDLIILIRDE
ncbi:MAG: septum formation initiator family protein [Pseudomonadota bacterium]